MRRPARSIRIATAATPAERHAWEPRAIINIPQGPCTQRVVARLGSVWLSRSCRSGRSRVESTSRQGSRGAGIGTPESAKTLLGRQLSPMGLGIIGRGRISVGMMPSPGVVSDRLLVLKGSRACVRRRLDWRTSRHCCSRAGYQQLSPAASSLSLLYPDANPPG